jgi:hypothetical protein
LQTRRDAPLIRTPGEPTFATSSLNTKRNVPSSSRTAKVLWGSHRPASAAPDHFKSTHEGRDGSKPLCASIDEISSKKCASGRTDIASDEWSLANISKDVGVVWDLRRVPRGFASPCSCRGLPVPEIVDCNTWLERGGAFQLIIGRHNIHLVGWETGSS